MGHLSPFCVPKGRLILWRVRRKATPFQTWLTSVSVTQDQIHDSTGSSSTNPINGLDAWADEGIAGRGILVDYLDYAQRNGIVFDQTKSHQITVEAVNKILEETNTVPEVGDILFLRTGFIDGYRSLSQTQRQAISSERRWPGFVQSKESVEWLWEKQFAAVVADNPAFECGRMFLRSE